MWHNTQKSGTCTIAQCWDLIFVTVARILHELSCFRFVIPLSFQFFSAATPTIERMLQNWFFISKSIDLFTFHFSLYFDLNKCRSNDLSSACSRCLLNVLRLPPSSRITERREKILFPLEMEFAWTLWFVVVVVAFSGNIKCITFVCLLQLQREFLLFRT